MDSLPTNKQHYFLVSGEIAFTHDDNMGSIRLNAIVTNTKKEIPVAVIGRAQQALQINFFKRMEDPDQVKVIDVIVSNFCYLGVFKPEEFHKAPKGTELQVVEDTVDHIFN